MKSVIKYTLVLLGLSLAVVALRDHLTKIPALIHSVSLLPLMIGVAGLLVYQFWNASVWSEVLMTMGLRCKRFDCMRIWLESESLKWLPGSVWSYGSRVVMAQKLGVTKKQASSSIVLELIITNVAWLTMAWFILASDPIMALVTPLLDQVVSFVTARVGFMILALFGVGILVLLGLEILIKSDRFKRLLELGKIDYTKCLQTTAHYAVLCLWNATMMWIVFSSIPELDAPYLVVLGVAGVAWLAGFWAVGIPGGIGVREAVIVLLLSQYGSVDAALLAAIVWRGAQMVAEIGSLMLSLGAGARVHLNKTSNHREGVI
ncbi:MAG: flippase-like domain-containing protein [Verrucomicrobiae bacterium]|nr:flippase-like domain-containing protein [Verrucomicrobiae bacterium]NNJ43593.1 hypothetical protein [Akkermansiaceae bacterium]